MNPKIKKPFSLPLISSGLILTLITLLICTQAQDTVSGFLGSLIAIRGVLFLCSLTLLVVGIYLYPTVRHGTIINILFLLPVISTFVMTVIIPFFLGVYYSLTDWTGVGMSQFVGFENYKGFINTPEYIHSFFATSAFTIINVLLVNLIAFALALLVTTKIKGRNFYRAGFFVPNLIGGIVLGYIWQFIFNYVFTGMASKLSLDMPLLHS